MNDMFCFQCEQTARGTGCTKAGVCGKVAPVANDQDQLIGSLVELAKAVQKSGSNSVTDEIVLKGLFTTITNVSFNEQTITELVNQAKALAIQIGGTGSVYDMRKVWNDNEDIRSLKSLILFGIKGMAAYAYHAYVLGYKDKEVSEFFYKALNALGGELGVDELLQIVLETGKVNLKCMELLDTANTESYGVPAPKNVTMTVEKGPFIVITGHDLKDLQLLLEQTQDKGINIYTHGEMLPAHGYPKLNKFPHLKGNFGTAWQNQQKEFANLQEGSKCQENRRDRVHIQTAQN